MSSASTSGAGALQPGPAGAPVVVPGRGGLTGSRRWAASWSWRSLRGRAALSIAAAVLALSSVAAFAVWSSVSQYLLLQRERSTLVQVQANAERLQRSADTGQSTEAASLAQLPRELGSTSLLVHDGRWSTTSLRVGSEDLPPALRKTVIDGQPARQRIRVGGTPMLAIGVPLAGLEEAYFEVFSLAELDSTFRVLGVVVSAAVLAAALLSVLVGWWVTAPALRPVLEIAEAAKGFAEGRLDTRMDPQDHRELVPIAELFNQAAGALERRVQADARFAADVSHELRNPLTTMVASIAVVERHRDRLPSDGVEGLDLLSREVQRFARMVPDLLELSRSEEGAGELGDADSVRLAELVRWALPEQLRERLVVEEGAASVTVRGDKRRLERAVTNLVENAERHGHGLAALTVSRDDNGAHIVVDDAGPGVPEVDRERIFERFTRGQGSSRSDSDGVGLGLSLVARHVRQLGGAVRVEPSPWGGARFVITVPEQDSDQEGRRR